MVTVYERDLNPYGHWVEVANYGRCWVPNNRPEGWRPYRYGHWANSDQGWVWVAEDHDADYGEVCYHYGRWYERPVGRMGLGAWQRVGPVRGQPGAKAAAIAAGRRSRRSAATAWWLPT